MSSRLSHPILKLSLDGITPSTSPPTLFDGTATGVLNQAGSFFSVPIWVDTVDAYRLVFTCPATGAPVGSVKLQACIDEATSSIMTPTVELVNWTDLSFSINGGAFSVGQAVNSATNVVLDENRCNYGWVRMVYTATSGLVSPTVKMRMKGLAA